MGIALGLDAAMFVLGTTAGIIAHSSAALAHALDRHRRCIRICRDIVRDCSRRGLQRPRVAELATKRSRLPVQLGILRPMRVPAGYRQFVCSLVAILLFVARTADAHVHLCPIQTAECARVYFSDGGIHRCRDGGAPKHAIDKEVRVVSDGLLKKADFVDQGAIPPPLWPTEFAPLCGGQTQVHAYTSGKSAARTYLWPPLRGPPN